MAQVRWRKGSYSRNLEFGPGIRPSDLGERGQLVLAARKRRAEIAKGRQQTQARSRGDLAARQGQERREREALVERIRDRRKVLRARRSRSDIP